MPAARDSNPLRRHAFTPPPLTTTYTPSHTHTHTHTHARTHAHRQHYGVSECAWLKNVVIVLVDSHQVHFWQGSNVIWKELSFLCVVLSLHCIAALQAELVAITTPGALNYLGQVALNASVSNFWTGLSTGTGMNLHFQG